MFLLHLLHKLVVEGKTVVWHEVGETMVHMFSAGRVLTGGLEEFEEELHLPDTWCVHVQGCAEVE